MSAVQLIVPQLSKKRVAAQRNFQNYALCGLDMDCRDEIRMKQLRQCFVYYEVAEGGIPAVQGMARTHEGVLEVALGFMIISTEEKAQP